MSITDNLRTRFRPEWKNRADLVGLDTMFETALLFMAAPKGKKAAIEAGGTLNSRGVTEALRRELGKGVVPELRRIRRVINERKEEMERKRAALAKPKIDASDVAGALLRQEMRAYLRGLSLGERMKVLSDKSDPAMLAAALEAPAALSGLTAETRAHVEEAYLAVNHAATLRTLDDSAEALEVVGVATELAVAEVRSNVGIEPHAFEGWFATADGTEGRQAA